MNPVEACALLATCVLAGLVVFQLALIMGAPIGKYAWGGQHRVLPRKLRIASATSIVLYAIFAWFALTSAGFVGDMQDSPIITIGIWVLFGYFVLGIVMNAASRSKRERVVMTPVATALAVLYLILALQ